MTEWVQKNFAQLVFWYGMALERLEEAEQRLVLALLEELASAVPERATRVVHSMPRAKRSVRLVPALRRPW